MKSDVSETRSASEMCVIKKLDDGRSPKEKIMSVSHIPSSELYRVELKSASCSDRH
jgi:hypothetical protein